MEKSASRQSVDNGPAYLRLSSVEWDRRRNAARRMLSPCRLCPRQCRALRRGAGRGFCHSGAVADVAHWQVHFGEEPPLSAPGGAGTIFFNRCNLRCVFCQNYQISQGLRPSRLLPARQLAQIMVELQEQGAQNIDLVSPQHFLPQIIEAVAVAAARGLRIPLVYNTNGYERPAALALLRDVVDIYVPDLKYAAAEAAQRYSGVADYLRYAQRAVAAMYAQVGDLVVTADGRAVRGLLVRHLVLPGLSAAGIELVRWVRARLGAGVGISVMSQYAPCAQAVEYPELNRTVRIREYNRVVDSVVTAGFIHAWIQKLGSNERYFPDFTQPAVFRAVDDE